MLFGSHVSIAGGIFNAPENSAKVGGEVFQIFSRSPRGGRAPELTPEVLQQFKSNLKKFKQKEFYIHAPYYINLASGNNKIYYGSISILRDELERGSKLGAKYLMFHLGSGKEFGAEKSVEMAAAGLSKMFEDYRGTTMPLIENSAGAGAILGDSFEEIALILEKVKDKRLGVCFDTCHAFASGYDLRTKKDLDKTLADFDRLIGLEKLKLIHLNDSKTEFASHRDRHADIGYGLLGIESFKAIANNSKLKKVNAILETPEENIDYKKSLLLLNKVKK
jgi:deoxyribonuclease-4